MDYDQTQTLRQQVLLATHEKQPMILTGNGTKSFYGRTTSSEIRPLNPGDHDAQGSQHPIVLNTTCHNGIINYEPSELVVTARSGTPLEELEKTLASQNQMLPFDPPYFGTKATLGGTVATGFSGPRRPYTGSLRDFVLGCKILNGKGEVLSFGGRVMKNVAGYDLSRLMVGALGTLGVLLEVSLKVLPKPEHELTLVYPMDTEAALSAMQTYSRQPWPLSAMAYDASWLHLRLSGSEQSVVKAAERLGGKTALNGELFWQQLKEQQNRFFTLPTLGQRLWRISVAPATPPLQLSGHWYYDWGGALRWLRTDQPADQIFTAVACVNGHATLFKGHQPGEEVFQPLPAGLKQLHINLKKSLDPHGLFNPGRLYGYL